MQPKFGYKCKCKAFLNIFQGMRICISIRFHDIRLALPWSLHWIHPLHVQLGLFSKLGVKKFGKKSDEGKIVHSLANGFKLKTAARLFWCEHVWNNIISRAICWWRLMHVFTFSVSHYKPRTCYKKSGSRCGTNRQGHHAEPTNNSCCFGVCSKGDCRRKAERVHGMCWCDTHAWLQYDGGISRSCCYGSCWSFRSNVQYSAWNWLCLETS